MYNQSMLIYREILEYARANPLSGERIIHAVSGSKWTVVQSQSGYGLAMTVPSWKNTRHLKIPLNQTLGEVSEWILSWDFAKASLGAASINCILNRENDIRSRFTNVSPKGDLLSDLSKKDLLVSVGDFPFLKKLDHQNLIVLEKDPTKGSHPDTACEEYLPQADIVIITGATLINKSLHRILELSSNARAKILIGPSTPAAPCLLNFTRLTQLGVTVLTKDPQIPILAGLGASRELFDPRFSQALDIFAEQKPFPVHC